MLTKCRIRNYKSVRDLEFSPGRLNVFIGENGCGKSNIIEALAFAAAANSLKLDNEFLNNRGIRTTTTHLMCSAFKAEEELEELEEFEEESIEFDNEEQEDNNKILIDLKFSELKSNVNYSIVSENSHYPKWKAEIKKNDLEEAIKEIFSQKIKEKLSYENVLVKGKGKSNSKFADVLVTFLEQTKNEFQKELNEGVVKIKDYTSDLNDFIIYSPENTSLRNFYKEGQVEPLSMNGDGLLKLLRVISEKSAEQISEITRVLNLFGWFDSIQIPKELDEKNDGLVIKDKFTVCSFDQKSANEGFLFILFYVSLFVSDDSPKIFAIDNIDASLNPKLCTRLISEIAYLAKKYKKQVFVTTHNPAALDGIDLNDEEQRLFVISRRESGETRLKRIVTEKKPVKEDGSPMKLSDALLRGYLGGLPQGF